MPQQRTVIPLYIDRKGNARQTRGLAGKYNRQYPLTFKRGRTYEFHIYFVENDLIEYYQFDGQFELQVLLKTEGQFDADALVSGSTITAPATINDPYVVTAAFTAEELDTALFVDENPANDLTEVRCEFEVVWSEDDWTTEGATTDRILAIINNNLKRDGDTTSTANGNFLQLSAVPRNAFDASTTVGLRGARQRLELAALSGTASSSGNITVTVDGTHFDAAVAFEVPIVNGDSAGTVADKIVAFLNADDDLAEFYELDSPGATGLGIQTLTGEAEDATLSLVVTSELGITGGTATETVAGVAETPITYIGQMARLGTVAGAVYFFRADTLATWTGATPGLLFDDVPETGNPRWKVLKFTGSGAGRTLEAVDI